MFLTAGKQNPTRTLSDFWNLKEVLNAGGSSEGRTVETHIKGNIRRAKYVHFG